MGKQSEAARAAPLTNMKTSQTMPQLYYTRQDIQEQYLANTVRNTKTTKRTTKLIDKSTSSALGASAGASRRARSTDQKLREPNDSGGEPDSCSENEEPPETSGRGRGAGRWGARKRQRRAHSLFAGCFHLPESLSSMLSPQPSGSQQRRSILAHLRLGGGGGNSDGQARRPISSSQTAGNLQQVGRSSPEDDKQQLRSPGLSGGPSSGRKHVSFGQQRNATGRPSIDSQPTKPELGTPIQRQPTQGERGLEGAQKSKSLSNTVIMRNYQAHQPPLAPVNQGKCSRVYERKLSGKGILCFPSKSALVWRPK